MILETSRCLLRSFRPEDFHDTHEYAQLIEVTRYQSWGPNNEEQSREFLTQAIEGFEPIDGASVQFAIVDRKSSKVLGGCGLHTRRKAFREFEIGWSLNPAHWRCGIGTEAASAVIKYAFSTRNAHRLFARIDNENTASIALAEKLNFVREGLHRQDAHIRGKWRDTLIYARLEEDSKPARL